MILRVFELQSLISTVFVLVLERFVGCNEHSDVTYTGRNQFIFGFFSGKNLETCSAHICFCFDF